MDLTITLEPWHAVVGVGVLLLCVSLWLSIRARRAASSATLESPTPESTREKRETVKVAKADAVKAEAAKAEAAKTEAAKAEAAKTEAAKTEAAKKVEAVKAKAAKAEAAKVEAVKAKAAKTEAKAANTKAAKTEAKAAKTEAKAAKTKAAKTEAAPGKVEAVAKVEATEQADREQTFVIFAGEATAALLSAALSVPHVFVKNREEFLAAAKREPAAAFIDVDLLFQFKGERPIVPVIGLLDDSDTLAKTVRALEAFPWLDQVIATTMLSSAHARSSLDTLVRLLIDGPEQGMHGATGVGRVALLAQSNHREARFERMHEFFSKHGLSAKAINAINEVSEELVMNALYDAPAEAGYFKEAISRTEEVTLPPDRACEISYGVDGGNVFVRVRDSFGSLSRTRLHEVLSRCNSKAVALDESRGGAGLGLWRIFSTASMIAITVIPGHVTDVVVRMATTNGRIVKKLHAVHLFFGDEAGGSFDSWIPPHHESDLMDQSITLVLVA